MERLRRHHLQRPAATSNRSDGRLATPEAGTYVDLLGPSLDAHGRAAVAHDTSMSNPSSMNPGIALRLRDEETECSTKVQQPRWRRLTASDPGRPADLRQRPSGTPLPPDGKGGQVPVASQGRTDPEGYVTGHWRAISSGIGGSMTVTNGASTAQLRAVRALDRTDSQADNAGSIPVTRSRQTTWSAGRTRWRPHRTGPGQGLTCH